VLCTNIEARTHAQAKQKHDDKKKEELWPRSKTSFNSNLRESKN
jgi:hypothetical protein